MKFFIPKKIKIIIIGILSWLIVLPALAWDATGHKIIASIAYDHLLPSVKTQVDQLTKLLDKNYPPYQRFLYAAVVADKLRNQGNKVYNNLHFIDYPYSVDGTATVPVSSKNVVWAIHKYSEILKNPSASNYQKAKALRFLIHFVGDAHQPLHCANFFSKQFPHGDQGGNLYLIKDDEVKNLHALWDQGVGLFHRQGQRYPLSTKNVSRLAGEIEKKYPPVYFDGRANNLDVQTWSLESFDIAKKIVYQTPENAPVSSVYVAQGQQITAQQLALAGYRLANLLNSLLSYGLSHSFISFSKSLTVMYQPTVKARTIA